MKVYVAVEVLFDEAGAMRPKTIVWGAGRRFEITHVSDVRRAASPKAGGTGIRYTCTINGREVFLWYEGPQWFVDSKQ